MVDIDLDLQAVEDQLEAETGEARRVVLGILDGSTPDEEWVTEVEAGAVLVLAVDGADGPDASADVNDLAAGFAREVSDLGGELVSFRGFLLVTPPGVAVDTDRLGS